LDRASRRRKPYRSSWPDHRQLPPGQQQSPTELEPTNLVPGVSAGRELHPDHRGASGLPGGRGEKTPPVPQGARPKSGRHRRTARPQALRHENTTTQNLLRGVLKLASEAGKLLNNLGYCLGLTEAVIFINRDRHSQPSRKIDLPRRLKKNHLLKCING
jgi:hypothetical protein